jgi:hypothetical protein
MGEGALDRTDNMSQCLTKRGGNPFLFFFWGVEEECIFGVTSLWVGSRIVFVFLFLFAQKNDDGDGVHFLVVTSWGD